MLNDANSSFRHSFIMSVQLSMFKVDGVSINTCYFMLSDKC